MTRVLIFDDDPNILERCTINLPKRGFEIIGYRAVC